MPRLIKNITAVLADDSTGNIQLVKSLNGEIQGEDFINLGGFIAYTQDLRKTEETMLLDKPLLFGLKNNMGIKVLNINIDY